MSLLDALRVALLVIGVSSVIVLIAVGQGTQKGVTDSIRGLGTDLIFVQPGVQQGTQGGAAGGAGSAQTLTTSDADAIAEAFIPGVIGVSPQLNINAQAVAGTENLGVTIVGTSADYAEVHDTELRSGGFLSPELETDLVVVLGSRVAETLFPGLDPVGQDVRLSFAGGRLTLGFLVIGVMEERGGSGGEADDQVFIDAASLLSRIRFLRGATGGSGSTPVSQIDIQTAPGVDEERVKIAISELLLFLHETTEPDFVIQSQDDLISAATEVSNTLSILLGSIAGISLLVGGIGIMNIMLATARSPVHQDFAGRATACANS